ncbi:MMS19 nucleotide excision repair protein-like protein [Drosera capensis]
MAKSSSEWIAHIESFVDSTRSPIQQAVSVNAVANLLMHGVLTLEQLVRDMEMYLTTSDNVLRSRGTLFLGQVLTCLATMPLDAATVHTLTVFFSERLSDWRGIRGPLVGCLALIRRKFKVGRVTGDDAHELIDSYLRNLEVQTLGHHDRKLCFELLECLLDCYPEDIAELGDHLVYGVCQAIEGEKDPHCLMHIFRIVKVLAGIFPDPDGPVANVAEEIFDTLGCYFPIHNTHPKGEDVDVSREKLSTALMMAFSSTPFFKPFAIPLLLEKLDSSLPLAKVDSLKYLSCCATMYGPKLLGKHAEAIWASLKSTILYSAGQPASPSTFDWTDSMSFQGNEIMKEAFSLLQIVTSQPDNAFLDSIIQDTEINNTVNQIQDLGNYDDIPQQNKHKLLAVGRVLSILAKASLTSCNRVFEIFLVRLLDVLGVSQTVVDPVVFDESSKVRNFGALYLSIQIITASRDLALASMEFAPCSNLQDCTWFRMVNNYSSSFVKVLSSSMMRSGDEKHLHPSSSIGVNDNRLTCNSMAFIYKIHAIVGLSKQYSEDTPLHRCVMILILKGLEVLATFPGCSLPISKSIFESILMILVDAVTTNFAVMSLLTVVLKSLVHIGSFVDCHSDKEKSSCYLDTVVRKILLFLSTNRCSMPLSVVLKAIVGISTTGLTSTAIITQAMEKSIVKKLSVVFVAEDNNLTGDLIQLLECYSSNLLPRMHELGGFEEETFRFASDVCEQIKKSAIVESSNKNKELLTVILVALKLAVANFSREKQRPIVEKVFMMFSLRESFLRSPSVPSQFEGYLVGDTLAYKDNWIISIFAAIVIALDPKTSISDTNAVVMTFMGAVLKGHVLAAQALGSMVNKMHLKGTELGSASDFYLEDILDIVFKVTLWSLRDDVSLSCHGNGEHGVMCLIGTESVLQVNWILGLAWIGKGLLMRGHEKVNDITLILLQCLLSNSEVSDSPQQSGPSDDGNVQRMLPLMRSAADAFHTLMSDSEDCLNKRFHATVRPLYKQRLFSTLTSILLTSLTRSQSSMTRCMVYRALGHIISDTPLAAVLGEMKKLVRVILDALSVLAEDILNKDIVYSLLLVLSAVLTDKNGHEVIEENAPFIVNCLCQLVPYRHKMLVRETAIQCLITMTGVTHARIYPMSAQVLKAVSKVLDDPKRAVRQEAVRCWHAWRSIA